MMMSKSCVYLSAAAAAGRNFGDHVVAECDANYKNDDDDDDDDDDEASR